MHIFFITVHHEPGKGKISGKAAKSAGACFENGVGCRLPVTQTRRRYCYFFNGYGLVLTGGYELYC